jgi:hypothetical protein
VRLLTNYIGLLSSDGQEAGARQARVDDEQVFGDEDGFWTSIAGNHFFYAEPEPDEINAMQRSWLKSHLDRFESVLYGPNFRDTENGYLAFVEPLSFIDYHLLMEATKNVDAFRFSTFFHKERGEKIKMGPIWDMNLTFGNANTKEGYLPEHWLWPQLDDQQYTWFRRLFEDPEFAQKYVDRWAELRATALATSNLLARVDTLAAQLEEAQRRNFKRWPILGVVVPPNHFAPTTYAEEVAWMKSWIEKRLAWMEAQFLAAPGVTVSGSGKERVFKLEARENKGQIYYTLDGSDPRLKGGKPSPRALAYKEGIKCGAEMSLVARVQVRERWSGPLTYNCAKP